MIREVIVVEGKNDIAAVKRAVDADCIATQGFRLAARQRLELRQAYDKRGLIILTDPDSAGERIRRWLTKEFPLAKHAFVPKEEACVPGDIGIEQASPQAILKALSKVRYREWQPLEEFGWPDLLAHGLNGTPSAAERRAQIGAKLGIGYANAKTFLQRLNHYGIARAEFSAAVAESEGSE